MRFSDAIFEAKEEQHIKNYLESMTGQHISDKNFKCINSLAHKKGDKHPSANIYKGHYNCFACGLKGNIFKMCEYLEGLPEGSEDNYRRIFDFCNVDVNGDFHTEYESFMQYLNNGARSHKRQATPKSVLNFKPMEDEPTIKENAPKVEIIQRSIPCIPEDYSSKSDMLKYLKIFGEDDFVCYCVKLKLNDGKTTPTEQPIVKASELVRSLEEKSIPDTFGEIWRNGAYIKFNSLDGRGKCEENVTSFNYCLLEADEQSLEEQYSILTSSNLPIKFLIYSGNKSIHAVVRVDAKNKDEYDKHTKFIYNYAEFIGLKCDKVCTNPNRFTRLPGLKRGDKLQRILDEDIGCESYEDFFVWTIEQGIYTDIEAEKMREYKKRSVSLKSLEAYNRATLDEPTRTGFDKLDFFLSGGVRNDLYTLISGTGIGKTSLCLQIADTIARQRRDVLYFSLEMSQAELIAKSLSRISFENESEVYRDNNKITFDRVPGASVDTNDILLGFRRNQLKDDQLNALAVAEEEYNQFSDHLYIESGINIDIDYIRQRVREHKEILGVKPCVFIDYIQIVGLVGAVSKNLTDKQVLDSTILGLKQLSNDEKIPIFCISSIPKSENNKKELDALSGKNSALLGFTSSTTFTITSEDQEQYINDDVIRSQDVTLTIAKNRYGARNQKIKFLFYPKYSCYREKELLQV